MSIVTILSILVSSMIVYAAPLIFTSIGGAYSEHAGVVNVGLEGIMVMGAFSGIIFNLTFEPELGSLTPWLSLIVAAGIGVLFSLIHAVATIHFRADHIVSGTVLNLMAPPLAVFLVKAMSNMMKEAGGVATEKAKQIKSEQLFGIELYRKVYALACANMLIHKDGKTNLRQMDAMSEDAADFIRDSKITKVLMNPPYERKYGCMKIVTNVLDNVPAGTKAAFILPNTKLDKDGGKKLLKNHTLETIVRLPSKTFINVGVETAIFIFTAGLPHPKHKKIQGYYIEEDGLETVKNQGRHDINGLWENDYEDYWVTAIANHEDDRYGTRLPIDPNERLSYPDPEVPFELNMEDFMKVAMDYHMFETRTDIDGLKETVVFNNLYGLESEGIL